VICDRTPSVVGAYVLGALEPGERRAAEEHLARCPDCTAELAAFRGLPALLARVPADEAAAEPLVPSPDLYDRVAAAVRRPSRRRWAAVAAAAAVLAAAGITWAGVRDEGMVRTATAGGVRMSVEAEERADGSRLDVTVTGLPQHVECRLVVVDDDGGRHAEGEWTTYGDEISYRVESEVPADDLADVVLLDAAGEELVRVRFG
jgi:anti-sigma factor RsiW